MFIYESDKKPDERKSKEDEQTLAEWSCAHPVRKQNVSYLQTSYIERIKLFLFAI